MGSTYLKPCPFCGTAVSLIEEVNCPYIKCIKCGVIYTPEYVFGDKTQALIDRWNTRTSGWISVDDALPSDDMVTLIYCGNFCQPVSIAERQTDRDGYGFWNDSTQGRIYDDTYNVTHWMPLPDAPKES